MHAHRHKHTRNHTPFRFVFWKDQTQISWGWVIVRGCLLKTLLMFFYFIDLCQKWCKLKSSYLVFSAAGGISMEPTSWHLLSKTCSLFLGFDSGAKIPVNSKMSVLACCMWVLITMCAHMCACVLICTQPLPSRPLGGSQQQSVGQLWCRLSSGWDVCLKHSLSFNY